MESLAALSAELGQPGANKLYQAAQRRGLDVDRKAVADFVRPQGERQVFRDRPVATGKIVATRINDRWAADLIDYASRSQAKGDQYILIVQDIFSRRVWGKALTDKTAESTLSAFKDIVREAGKGKPRELDTDDGAEFKRVFDDYLAQEGIQHTIADKRNKDARGTLDYAIRTVRQTIARLQLSSGREWSGLVSQAVHAWNENIHSALIGRAPEDIGEDDDAKFLLTEKAAAGIQHNQKEIEARGKKLEQAGGFRDELPRLGRGRERAFKPKWSDKVHPVDDVVGGTVFSGAESYPTRHALAVPRASADVNTKALGAGNTQMDRLRLEKLQPYKDAIKNFVGAERWLGDVANHMRVALGMGAVLSNGLLPKKALQLLGYRVEPNGKVRPPPRRRLRGKQRLT